MKTWETIPPDHLVDVRYPYEKHGLSGKVSNNAKLDAKMDFLKFVDENSQENGRRFDSKNATHYFLPKFTSVTIPKTSDPKYQEKLQSSLTGEFNRAQAEMGKQTSDFLFWAQFVGSKVQCDALNPVVTDFQLTLCHHEIQDVSGAMEST